MNINESTLVFKLGSDNNFSDLNITSEIKNFIADLSNVDVDTAKSISDKLLAFSKSVETMKGSFVVVCNFSFDDELIIVPTLLEAYDYIEMEEMERQLEE